MGLDVHVLVPDRFLGTDSSEIPDDVDGFYFEINNDSEEVAHFPRGWYTQADECHFRVGPYRSFNDWRRELCLLVHGKEWEDTWDDRTFGETKPFGSLLHHSDCDGEIGPTESAKLFEDFKTHQHLLGAIPNDFNGVYFKEKYLGWMEVFQLASEKHGTVRFS